MATYLEIKQIPQNGEIPPCNRQLPVKSIPNPFPNLDPDPNMDATFSHGYQSGDKAGISGD